MISEDTLCLKQHVMREEVFSFYSRMEAMHVLHKNSSYVNQLHVLITKIFTYLSASPGLAGMVEQNRSKVLECSDFGMQLK